MFWGECDKAECCIEKDFKHCGECSELALSDDYTDLINDPEHGDNGMDVGLCNLRNWKNGNCVYKKLNNLAQEQAKKL